MNKAELGELLIKTAALIRTLKKERDEYKQKLADLQLHNRIEKIAAEMRAKGINTHLSEEELKADLEKHAKEGKLDMIEESIKLAGGNVNFTGLYGIGNVDNSSPSSVSAAALEAFIKTGEI